MTDKIIIDNRVDDSPAGGQPPGDKLGIEVWRLPPGDSNVHHASAGGERDGIDAGIDANTVKHLAAQIQQIHDHSPNLDPNSNQNGFNNSLFDQVFPRLTKAILTAYNDGKEAEAQLLMSQINALIPGTYGPALNFVNDNGIPAAVLTIYRQDADQSVHPISKQYHVTLPTITTAQIRGALSQPAPPSTVALPPPLTPEQIEKLGGK